MSQIYSQPYFVAQSDSGAALGGAKLYFYRSQSSDLVSVFKDDARTMAHDIPVKADSNGRFPIIYLPPIKLKSELTDAADATIRVTDPCNDTRNVVNLGDWMLGTTQSSPDAEVAADSVRMQDAVNEALATNTPLYIPSERMRSRRFRTDRTIDVAGVIDIFGDGPTSVVTGVGLNGPLFRFNLNSTANFRFLGSFRYNVELPSTSANSGSCAVEIAESHLKGELTAVGQTTATLQRLGAVPINLAGPFTATVVLERSTNGGSIWAAVESYTAPVSRDVFRSGWDQGGPALYRLRATDFTSGTVKYDLGHSYFQYSRIHDITTMGAFCVARVTAGTRTTDFGEESLVNWTDFERLQALDGETKAKHVTLFERGSGTGNRFIGFKGALGARDASYCRFETYESSPGVFVPCAVGDILFEGGHLHATGDVSSSAISVGPHTVYRTNIAVNTTQIDAAVNRVFDLSDVGSVKYENVMINGSLIGGATTPGVLPPMINARIADKGRSLWDGGFRQHTAATGPQIVELTQVELSPYRSATISLTVTGSVGGVSSGVCRQDFLLRSDATTAYAVAQPAQVAKDASAGGGFFALQSAFLKPDTPGLILKFSVAFTPAASGTDMKADWSVTGLGFTVRPRLTA